jgi:AcrR family transcriptional regulator
MDERQPASRADREQHPSRPGSVPVWARPEPGTRQPRFSREQIAAAALAIADEDGFDAVSMRRIASKLGAGTMSLYRYIETKADLLALINDALLGEALVPGDLPADWRKALSVIARHTRQAFLSHPWAVQILQGRSAAQAGTAGPNALRHFEQSLASVADAPLSTEAKLDLLVIIDEYVLGHVLRAAETAGRAEADATSAFADGDFVRAQLDSGDYPHLSVLLDDPAAATVVDSGRLSERFELGLQLIIDGVAAGVAGT